MCCYLTVSLATCMNTQYIKELHLLDTLTAHASLAIPFLQSL